MVVKLSKKRQTWVAARRAPKIKGDPPVIDGKPAYARESDHWGKFSTSDFVDGERVEKGHNWTLPGVEATWGNKKRYAGYVLLEDLK